MRRILAVLCLVLLAPLAAAETLEESIVRQLRDQGFTEFTIRQTLLGRLQIIALSPGMRREIVVNPQTGVILRDYWSRTDDDGSDAPRLVDPRDDDDRDDDNRDDDDRDDDDRDDDDRDDDDRDEGDRDEPEEDDRDDEPDDRDDDDRDDSDDD